MKIKLILFLMIGAFLAAAGQTAVPATAQTSPGAVMIKDIFPGGSASPQQFTEVNGLVFFTATDGSNGVELWKSDGTEAGTTLVKDINPGGDSWPLELVDFGGVLYFTADDGVHGYELWRSDGTEAGTVMVADIMDTVYFGRIASNPDNLTVMDGVLYFSAYTQIAGEELWRYEAGMTNPAMVKEINPGGGTIGDANPNYLTVMDNILYFSADDGPSGSPNFELWRTDGTETGTWQVVEVNPTGSASLAHLFPLNGTLYFVADDGTHGKELWQSDGSLNNAALVKDIYAGATGSGVSWLTAVGNTLYFAASDGTHGQELWQSDGATAGTQMTLDIESGSTGSAPHSLVVMNGDLYFSAYTAAVGWELWVYRPDSGVTELVKDVNPAGSFSPSRLTVVGDLIYFQGTTNPTGFELGQTDGTEDGTILTRDINPGAGDSFPSGLTAISGALYFQADDGVNGAELWRSYGLAGVTAAESAGDTAVSEDGVTDSYTLALDEQPLADVTVTLTPDNQLDLGNGAGNALQLTFTGSDWDTPQTVTVTAVNDVLVEKNHSGIITHTVASGDSYYDGYAVPNVVAAITDNDNYDVYLPLIVRP